MTEAPKYYYRIKDVPLVPLTDKVGTRFIKGIDIFIPPREDYLELMRKHGL